MMYVKNTSMKAILSLLIQTSIRVKSHPLKRSCQLVPLPTYQQRKALARQKLATTVFPVTYLKSVSHKNRCPTERVVRNNALLPSSHSTIDGHGVGI